MIERGSGRTSGLTDWRLMDVLSMWACLQDHDTTGHWKQVAGWRKVSELALTHLSRLKEYRRGLAEAWPPETNAAARAYIGELDQLIDKVQRTHDAAAANYDALAAATRALGSTRAELEPLYQEYAAKLQQKQAYEATVADPKAVAGSRLPEQPPVTDGDLERLNVQARGLMTGLSGELQQAQVMLRQPPPRPNISRQPDERDLYGPAVTPPVIPPIVPVPMATTRVEPSPNMGPPAIRPAPPPTAPNVGPVIGSGPVLGGAGTGLAPAPIPSAPPGITSALPSPGLGVPSPLPPLSGPLIRGSTVGPNDRTRPGVRPSADRANGLPHSGAPRPMPPGGMIGGAPGAALGQPSSGATPPRRINPTGGVIGGGGAGTAPSGGAGSRPGAGRISQFGTAHGLPPIGGGPGMGPASETVGLPGRTSRDELRDGEPRRWDPHHPWETDEGVAPIVRPPEDDGPINPGPAIGFGR
ncbi:hypothetical protein GCM10023176_18850 [Micromonospora coerulea]|uniref:PPE family protein n=1 Tax=Micromonospora coerulea TaxID=47856 RepID=A0ABP8SFV5_9ACTN